MKLLSKSEQDYIKQEFLSSLGNTIKTRRLEKNISQDELAKAIGVDRTTLVKYENGTRDMTASTLPLISIYCDFPMRKYIDVRLDQKIFDKFRTIANIESDRYKRKQLKEKNTRKTLTGKVYMVDGQEVIEPISKKKMSRMRELIECRETFPVKPFTRDEFIAYIRSCTGNEYAIIDSSDEILKFMTEPIGNETVKGEIADYVIKEIIARPICFDKDNSDIPRQRLYMLYKELFDGTYIEPKNEERR